MNPLHPDMCNYASAHRFRKTIAIHIDDKGTTYFDEEALKGLQKIVNAGLKSLRKESFQESTFGDRKWTRKSA